MKSEDTQKGHSYRLLGESGLVEDEEGNIYSASEVDDTREPEDPEMTRRMDAFRERVVKNTFVSQLDDKGNPAYWYHHYDERFCGPDREAYMEEMARKYRETTQLTPDEAVKEAAAREQEEVERRGIHPVYRRDRITVIYGLNFIALTDNEGYKIVTNKEYFFAENFYNGRSRVLSRKTKKFGFIDLHGEEVIPCTWRSAGQFSEYLAAVQNDECKCGYVDVSGRVVIPCTWVEAWPFHEELARVQGDHRRIGMIDHSGKLVIPCEWIAMGDFSEGLAGVRDDDGKCGYIDKTGRVVIPCQWKQVWTFSEGRAVVQDFNKRLGFIDHSGKLVIPCRWKKVSYFKDGRARVTDSWKSPFQRKWEYIDKEGHIITK